jgi:nitrogen-specific signal transduction histidine kinase
MKTVKNLLQPITGEVDGAGNLVRADAAMLRLQIRAGGSLGGPFALPALAELSARTHRLKMRLSDVVRVADDDQDLEFWVETEFRDEQCHLQIWGWAEEVVQPKAIEDQEAAAVQFDEIDGVSVLICDADRHLVAAHGDINQILTPASFGAELGHSLILTEQLLGTGRNLASAIAGQQSFSGISVKLAHVDKRYIADGEPQFAKNGAYIGCRITLRDDRRAANERNVIASDDPSRLIGQQIAPVLRQPLSRIIANAETIGDKLRGPVRDNYAVYAQDIASAARHLMALLDDLSDLEAVERPDFKTAQEAVELGDLGRRVAGLLALKAADNQMRLIHPNEDQKIVANAEFRRVLQIVINLVSNAIRYSPHGSLVEIAIDHEGQKARISVSDEGNGVPPDDHEKIFAKFERLGRSGDGGSGLGLYISRRLARFMGGDLTVSVSAAGGAKFILELPLRLAA